MPITLKIVSRSVGKRSRQRDCGGVGPELKILASHPSTSFITRWCNQEALLRETSWKMIPVMFSQWVGVYIHPVGFQSSMSRTAKLDWFQIQCVMVMIMTKEWRKTNKMRGTKWFSWDIENTNLRHILSFRSLLLEEMFFSSALLTHQTRKCYPPSDWNIQMPGLEKSLILFPVFFFVHGFSIPGTQDLRRAFIFSRRVNRGRRF